MTSFSIISPAFNSEKTIEDCLKSIEGQSIVVEHIIIDGKSDDSTLDIIERFHCKNTKLVSEPDSGIFDAMNKGISLAGGDVIGILNTDDVYAQSNIIENVKQAFKNPQVEACYGDLEYISSRCTRASISSGDSENGYKTVRYWKSGSFNPTKFYWGWMPPHPTFFVRRSIYEKHGLFNLDLGTAADYEIMLRFLLKHRIKTVYIPEVLVKMRVGGASNRSLKARLAANRNDRKAWEVNGLKPYPWTIPLKPLRKIPQYFLKARD